MEAQRYVAIYDVHYGFEKQRIGGVLKTVPLHDQQAFDAILKFTEDFKPNTFLFGGDIIDCGSISHWNKHRKLSMEGFRFDQDLDGCGRNIIQPVNAILRRGARKIWLKGNHEDWVDQLCEENPALEGMLSLDRHLELSKRGYELYDIGGVATIGKLHFAHGDTVKGGEYCAKAAVLRFERNIRFGHHHTWQSYTKDSAVDLEEKKTGVAVPCVCRKAPAYAKQAPNRWVTGFNWGYVEANGNFTDYISIITNGQFRANDTLYRG
jgi:hypothetical protein